uniref:EF-hand domain-containing protein n=1 Tax=Globodera rostochiensis TaxID=31243 RepID=A0A914HZD3_GLORO
MGDIGEGVNNKIADCSSTSSSSFSSSERVPNSEFVSSICAQFEGNGGQIAIKRLKIVMRALGLEPRQAEVDEYTRKLLQNSKARQSKPLSFTALELAELLADRLQKDGVKGVDEELHSVFRLFDTDGKGFISVNDLRRVADELGERISEEEFREMITVAVSGRSGIGSDRVSETDFSAIMKKISLY